MRPGRLCAIGILAAMVLPAAPAGAGLSVEFDLPDAMVTISPANRVLAMPGPTPLKVAILDNDLPAPEIDSVSVPIPPFFLDVQVLEPDPGGDWTATGTLAFAEMNGDLGHPKVMAWLGGTDVTVSGSDLVISGPLVKLDAWPTDAILVGTGTSWSFAGIGAEQGADGNSGTVTIPAGRGGYDRGELTLTVGGVAGSLDSIFGATDTMFYSGEVTGSIVPAPGALALAASGIGLVGWLRRRVG